MANESQGERLTLVAMKGHPGSGKSTVAQFLSRSLKWPLLDKDDVRDSTLPIQNLIQSSSSSLLNELSYTVIWRIAETQLKAGISAIVDCPLSRPHLFHAAAAVAARCGARLLVVECRAADWEEWKRRLEDRGVESPSWHKPSSWHALQNLLEGYGGCFDYDTPAAKKLVVDTTAHLRKELILHAVLDWVTHGDGDGDGNGDAVTFFPRIEENATTG
uniref:Zeta toxin domain-containing protein n=1 Tax=Araucaria cunninghamii TaxID=56994 RepID=A0A0D6R3B9_ARACU